MNNLSELIERVQALTGLNARAAQAVAMSLTHEDEDNIPSAAEIVKAAEGLGYEFEKPEHPHKQDPAHQSALGARISVDPAEVLENVYLAMPRVLMQSVPAMGRVPEKMREAFGDEESEALLADMPDDVRAMLGKVNILDGEVTFWLYDEANDVDRSIGPVSLGISWPPDNPEQVSTAIERTFRTLVGRLERTLAADSN